MPRVKRGTKRRAKRKKILERASGYFLTKSKLHRSAKEAVDRALPSFLEMKSLGLTDRVPKISIVQAEGANPLYRSMKENCGDPEPRCFTGHNNSGSIRASRARVVVTCMRSSLT